MVLSSLAVFVIGKRAGWLVTPSGGQDARRHSRPRVSTPSPIR